MTLEKTKHQSMLCTDNENKHIHNYIHNLDAKESRLCNLHINVYELAHSVFITEFLRLR